MAARVWFTQTNSGDLSQADVAVLNCAVRNAFPPKKEPTRLQLMEFRMAYRPGMSATDVVAATSQD